MRGTKSYRSVSGGYQSILTRFSVDRGITRSVPGTTEVDTRSGGFARRSMVDCMFNGVGEASKSLDARFSACGESSSNSIGGRTVR